MGVGWGWGGCWVGLGLGLGWCVVGVRLDTCDSFALASCLLTQYLHGLHSGTVLPSTFGHIKRHASYRFGWDPDPPLLLLAGCQPHGEQQPLPSEKLKHRQPSLGLDAPPVFEGVYIAIECISRAGSSTSISKRSVWRQAITESIYHITNYEYLTIWYNCNIPQWGWRQDTCDTSPLCVLPHPQPHCACGTLK